MTEQESLDKAINGLEQFIADFKPFCGNKADWQRVYDALDLLKAQEPCEDAVSRKDVINVIKSPCDMRYINGNWQPCIGDYIEAINNLPAAAPKAHEPRVMTLEEIKALPDYVFLEDRDISHAFSIKTISRPALPQLVFVNISGEECVGFRGPDGDTSLVTSRYRVEWRCWTSRPTDEQREATPWEG